MSLVWRRRHVFAGGKERAVGHHDERERFVEEVLADRLSRRALVRRAGALGLTAPSLSALVNARGIGSAAAAQGGGSLHLTEYSGGDPVARARMAEDITAFEAQTGIDVDVTTVEIEAFKQAIGTYLTSEVPLDVLTWQAGNRMRFFVEQGLILPVTDLFEGNGWTTAYPEGIRNLCKGTDGQYFFVPTTYYWVAIYYRPSLFQQAGIEAPPEDWSQFLAAVDKLNAAGIKPFTIFLSEAWPAAGWFDYLNMRINGPAFHIQLTDGKVAYNSPEVKEVFARWRELLDKKAWVDAPETLDWDGGLAAMIEGGAAMFLTGAYLRESFPNELRHDLDFFRFPIIDPSQPIGEDGPTDGFFAAARAANVAEAKTWLSWVGGAEYQEILATSLKQIAIHTGVPREMYDAPTQKGLQLLQGADYIAQYYDRDTTPEMAERGMAAFVEFWQNPDDVDQVLDSLDEERKRIFAAEA